MSGDSSEGDGTREWDAATYDRVSRPQLEWGRERLDDLRLEGDETVIDAGCGSGRVTELLLERLPRGRVIGVDGSAAMIEHARERFEALPGGERVELIHADLLRLELPERADAVFSTATFHWIHDHESLFERIYSWLRPGGRLVAQCGGQGNVASFLAMLAEVAGREPWTEYLGEVGEEVNFASAEASESRLLAAGFERVSCALERRPTRTPEPRAFLESVCLGAYLEALPPELRDDFVEAVAERWIGTAEERAAGPLLDYVRLNLSARKPEAG